MNEITYKHAEGFPAGELKHGLLGLVSERTPIFAIISGASKRQQMIGNVEEASRNAPVIAVTDSVGAVEHHVDARLSIPETRPQLLPILATVQLQLVSYWVANQLGRSIDKPRTSRRA